MPISVQLGRLWDGNLVSRPYGTFIDIWVYFIAAIWYFCGPFWNIFFHFVFLYQEKSGSPETPRTQKCFYRLKNRNFSQKRMTSLFENGEEKNKSTEAGS
jgi:hypothetical protein